MTRYALILASLLLASPSLFADDNAPLASALLFHVSFDGSADADFALGDPRAYTALSRTESKLGLHLENASFATDQGRHGHAIRFSQRIRPYLFYKADQNFGYRSQNWSGTVSLWLKLDPDKDLEPGYCDPFQAGWKSPTDEGIFLEWSRDHTPRRFRFVAAPKKSIWNPDDRKYEEMPIPERPVLELDRPIFSREKWTHVAFTFEKFNTGQKDGLAKLYLDGAPAGQITGWQQSYEWDLALAQLKVGLYYVGFLDDLAIFNRALTPAEIKRLHALPQGIKSLGRSTTP